MMMQRLICGLALLLACGPAPPARAQDAMAARVAILREMINTLGPAYAAQSEAMHCVTRADQQRLFLDGRELTARTMTLFDAETREHMIRDQTTASARYRDLPQPLRCEVALAEAEQLRLRAAELVTALRQNLERRHD